MIIKKCKLCKKEFYTVVNFWKHVKLMHKDNLVEERYLDFKKKLN